MKIASHEPEAMAGAVATFARKTYGSAYYNVELSVMETRTYFLICERYGALCAGEVHLKDYDGLCEGGELRGVELGELEVVQGQRGTSCST